MLAYLSQDFTLVPGDILSGGTAKGTAADMTPRAPDGSRSTDLFLKKGDEVVVSSAHIGALRLHITPFEDHVAGVVCLPTLAIDIGCDVDVFGVQLTDGDGGTESG